MAETWAVRWAAGWDTTRFNTQHIAAGHTGGGQFAPSSGSSPAASSKTRPGGTHAAAAPGSRQQRAAHLRDKAKADRAKAHGLQVQLRGLEQQHAAAAKAAKQAATHAARHPHKSARHAAAAHHRAHRKHRHHMSLQHRISALRTEIHTLLRQAKQYDAAAAAL